MVEPLRARPRGKDLGSEDTAFLVRVWKIRRPGETQMAGVWLMRYQRKQRLYWQVRKRPYCWYGKTKQNNNKKKNLATFFPCPENLFQNEFKSNR